MTAISAIVVYSCRLLDDDGRVCEVELEGRRADAAASVLGREVLARRPDRSAVEVRREGTLVCPVIRRETDRFRRSARESPRGGRPVTDGAGGSLYGQANVSGGLKAHSDAGHKTPC